MKNKFSKKLLILVCLIFFITSLHMNTACGLWEIENDTLIINNEIPGNLLNGRLSDQCYKNIIVKGKMSRKDFLSLLLISFGCKSIDLYDVDAQVIPDGTFRNKPELEKFVLPKNLRTIGAFAFTDCRNLKIDQLPDTIEEICTCAFEYCERLSLVIPDKISCGANAFYGCPNVWMSERNALQINQESVYENVEAEDKFFITNFFSSCVCM